MKERLNKIYEKNVSETYVIDKEKLLPVLFKRLPELGKRYQPTQWKGIYQLKSSNSLK